MADKRVDWKVKKTASPKEIAEATKEVALAKERVSSLDPHSRGYKETGVYTYKTDKAVESFKNTPYRPPIKARNDLSPASVYIEPTGSLQAEQNRELEKFCKQNPTHPRCFGSGDPRSNGSQGGDPRSNGSQGGDPRSSDESNPYQELGIFSEEVKNIFTPEGRDLNIEKGLTNKPVQNLYESTRDNTQLTKSPVVRTECKCSDGKVVLGYLDTRSGQKDCSPCNEKQYNRSTPNAYKNYKTKKTRRPAQKPTNLRNQVGVSTFGDVNMKGCQTGNNDRSSIKKMEAGANLNNVISTKQSRGQKVNPNSAIPINPSQSAFSIYDDCNMDIYGISK
jgi:hypothetical protein